MKLYVFDSCPFCVRSRMIVGLKDIECSLEYLVADDVETPTRMIGKKNVPILELDDGTYMGESWEINLYIDQLDKEPLMGEVPDTPRFEAWYKSFEKVYDLLCYPRMLKLNLPELNSAGAKKYFKPSREKVMGMSFDEALANTDDFKSIVESRLSQIVTEIPQQLADDKVTFDDFYLFPLLRGLTMVKDLEFPPEIENYLHNLSVRTGVPLYSNQAV